jgi:hypothetical protein
MRLTSKPTISPAEVLARRDEVAVVGALWAGYALGLAETATYNAIARGDFPVPVIKVGGKYLVRTVDLVRVLGLDEPADAAPVAVEPARWPAPDVTGRPAPPRRDADRVAVDA